MASQHAENPLVVTITTTIAIAGVVAMRTMMGLDYRHWAVAYLAMGLTASIRRTSAGNDCSIWSAWRGIACLAAGLYVGHLMGYPVGSIRPAHWVPAELAGAVDRLK